MFFTSTLKFLFQIIGVGVLVASAVISFLLPTMATLITECHIKFRRVFVGWVIRSIVALFTPIIAAFASIALASIAILLPIVVALHLGGLVSVFVLLYCSSKSLGWVSYPLIPFITVAYEWLYVAALTHMARNKVQGFRAFLSDYLPESWVRLIMEAERVGAPLQPPAEEEAHDGNDFSLLNSLSHVSQHFKQVLHHGHRGYQRVPTTSEGDSAMLNDSMENLV